MKSSGFAKLSTKIPNNHRSISPMALTIYLSLIFLALYLIGLAIQRWLFCARSAPDGGRKPGRRPGDCTGWTSLHAGSVKKFWLICQKYRLGRDF